MELSGVDADAHGPNDIPDAAASRPARL